MITQDDIRYLALLQHMRPRNHKTRVSHDNCGILELFCEKSKMQEVMRINYRDTFGRYGVVHCGGCHPQAYGSPAKGDCVRKG